MLTYMTLGIQMPEVCERNEFIISFDIIHSDCPI